MVETFRYTTYTHTEEDGDLLTKLNWYGSKGWEVCGIVTQNKTKIQFLLKRKI